MLVIILFSHYDKLAYELKNYLEKMVKKENQKLFLESLGGIDDGKFLGTDADALKKIIQKYPQKTKFIIFCDLGSAFLTSETVKILLADYIIHIAKGMFVENAFSTYVLANANVAYEQLLTAADKIISK